MGQALKKAKEITPKTTKSCLPRVPNNQNDLIRDYANASSSCPLLFALWEQRHHLPSLSHWATPMRCSILLDSNA